VNIWKSPSYHHSFVELIARIYRTIGKDLWRKLVNMIRPNSILCSNQKWRIDPFQRHRDNLWAIWVILDRVESGKELKTRSDNCCEQFEIFWNEFVKFFANQQFNSHSSNWFWFFRAKDFREWFMISWDPLFDQFDNLLFQFTDPFDFANGTNLKSYRRCNQCNISEFVNTGSWLITWYNNI
jgi:hypothetical protein